MTQRIMLAFVLAAILGVVLMIYIGSPKAVESLSLNDVELQNTQSKAEQCDMQALYKIIAHYVVKQDKEQFEFWQAEEKKCMEEKKKTSQSN